MGKKPEANKNFANIYFHFVLELRLGMSQLYIRQANSCKYNPFVCLNVHFSCKLIELFNCHDRFNDNEKHKDK